jgi:hypothetical protein
VVEQYFATRMIFAPVLRSSERPALTGPQSNAARPVFSFLILGSVPTQNCFYDGRLSNEGAAHPKVPVYPRWEKAALSSRVLIEQLNVQDISISAPECKAVAIKRGNVGHVPRGRHALIVVNRVVQRVPSIGDCLAPGNERWQRLSASVKHRSQHGGVIRFCSQESIYPASPHLRRRSKGRKLLLTAWHKKCERMATIFTIVDLHF